VAVGSIGGVTSPLAPDAVAKLAPLLTVQVNMSGMTTITAEPPTLNSCAARRPLREGGEAPRRAESRRRVARERSLGQCSPRGND